jgi:hypothetical protein
MPLFNVSGTMILPGTRKVVQVRVERMWAPDMTTAAADLAASLNVKHQREMPRFDYRITSGSVRALRWEEHRPVTRCGDPDCCG